MDAFSQQMLDSVERRSRVLGVSNRNFDNNSYSDVAANAAKEYDNVSSSASSSSSLSMSSSILAKLNASKFDVNEMDSEKNSVLTERNSYRSTLTSHQKSIESLDHVDLLYLNDENSLRQHYDYDDQIGGRVSTNHIRQSQSNEMIYENSSVVKRNDDDGFMETAFNNNTVPIGRKPALPPKPSSQVEMHSSSNSTARMATGLKREPLVHSSTKSPAKKDPAEMSLKERLALFEKKKDNALMPKAALGMSVSAKQIRLEQNRNDVVRTPLLTNSNYGKNMQMQQNTMESFAPNSSARQTLTTFIPNAIITKPEYPLRSEAREMCEEEIIAAHNRYQRSQSQMSDAVDGSRQPIASPKTKPPPPPPTKTQNLHSLNGNNTISSIDSMPHVEANCTVQTNNKRRSGDNIIDNSFKIHDEDSKRPKLIQSTNGPPNLYGDLMPIVTMPAPIKSPDQTIGLNELHQTDVNRSLLDDQFQQQQPKEEDSFTEFDSESTILSGGSGNYDGSLGLEFLSKKIEDFNSSTLSSANNDLASMDTYLEEALDDSEDDDFNCDDVQQKYRSARDASTVSTDSFAFTKAKNPSVHPDNTNITSENDEEDDYEVRRANRDCGLAHTVSFYRRQQAENINSSPIRKIVYPSVKCNTQQYSGHISFSENDDHLNTANDEKKVEEKIKTLMSDVSIQQHHMSQASHALNTCASTFEFSGSTESVVAEWKLLVTTHCRQAARNELTRLRTERCLRKTNAPQDSGRLIISEISLPLRQDYIGKLASDAICGHHLVCLLKLGDNEQVVATKTIPTLPGLLAVKFPDALQLLNVYADFRATLEIYAMTAQREILPHDIKYHIKSSKKNGGGGIKTPKGKKANDANRLVMPPVLQSPSGANAIRTSNFKMVGSVVISLRELKRINWTLEQLVIDDCPLTGTISMKLNCELSVKVDHKAFLTMFEDVSGFGAWHRRWCHLHGNVLRYWMYPDDERNKSPIGSIDLSLCKQTKIAVAPRDVCSRMNTLLIELRRPANDHDRDSLTVVRKGNETIYRHLLSCDTKEERDEWCIHLNKAIQMARAWASTPV